MNELNRKAGTAIEESQRELAKEIVSRQYRLESRVWERYGERGREYSLRDHNR